MVRWFGLAFLVLACGNDGASATFLGTVRGASMFPTDFISSQATVSFASGVVPAAAIVLSDAAALCTDVSANRQPSNSRMLSIFLTDVDAGGSLRAPKGTATYTIFAGSGSPPPHFAVASYLVDDESCSEVTARSATAAAGTVTLTGNADGAYAGTYDLTFDSGDRVTGAFHTAICRGLAIYLSRDSHVCG